MTENIHLDPETRVGVIGSGTTNSELVVDLVGGARTRPLNGRMVLLAPEDMDGASEFALGTVTEIENRNRFHEDPAMRGVIAQRGSLGRLTGSADIKTATVAVQAAFRSENQTVVPAGGSMTFAPNTGEHVHTVTQETIEHLARQTTDDLFYLGTIYREPGIDLPMSVPDFAGPRGASMAAFFGPSGTSKTATGTLYVASQMRHRKMSFLLIDPQGQFTTGSKVGTELPVDLRALAEAQSREVRQLSVAREVRLAEDAEMFTSMLSTTPIFHARHLMAASGKTKECADIVGGWLSEQRGWSERSADDLLDGIIEHLMNAARLGTIFASIKEPEYEGDPLPIDGTKAGNRLYHNLRSMLHPDEYDREMHDGESRRKAVMKVFAPFLSIFSPTAMDGTTPRVPISEIVTLVTSQVEDSAGKRKGRPFVVLTLADQVADDGGQAGVVSQALSGKEAQTIILRSLFSALERRARWLYQETDTPANLMVVMDEAARFASARDRRGGDLQRDFAEDLAQYFREIRKYAIGMTLFLQEPAALHDSIWKQLRNGFRAFAGGLVGSDLDRIKEQVGDQGALRLYSSLAVPSGANPKYTFMLCGSISPLSATGSPLFLEVFSGSTVAVAGKKWAEANRSWLPSIYNHSDTWRKPRSAT